MWLIAEVDVEASADLTVSLYCFNSFSFISAPVQQPSTGSGAKFGPHVLVLLIAAAALV